MRYPLLATLRGVLTLVLITLNVVLMFIPIFILAIFKLLIPHPEFRKMVNRWLNTLGEIWVANNKSMLTTLHDIHWDVRGAEGLSVSNWYLVIANHQSWADILVLQTVFGRRIPFLKFFIKHKLIWMPFMGLAWWAMDMPFMKRYTRQYVEKHPEMKGKDLEATRLACEKFRETPTSVINFVEGTRFTAEKHANRMPPYRHLLDPRAGGIAFTLSAMGSQFTSIIDATIVYGDGKTNFWDLCCGGIDHIVVDIKLRSVEDWLLNGNYADDEQYRGRIQRWISDLWHEKDRLIGEIEKEAA